MGFDRRAFLGQMFRFAAAGGLLGPAAKLLASTAAAKNAPSQKTFLLMGSGPRPKTYARSSNQTLPTNPGEIFQFHIEKGEMRKLPLPFTAHGFTQDSRLSMRMASFEKWSHHAVLFHLGEREARWIKKETDYRFFGHGAFSSTEAHLFATQMNDAKNRGEVGIFDVNDGKRIGEILTYGNNPHDCFLDGKGNIVLTTLRKPGERGCNLNWIELKSGKLVHQIHLDLGDSRVVSHLCPASDGWILGCGVSGEGDAEKLPGVVLAVAPDGKYFAMTGSEALMSHLLGETLSLACNSKGQIVAATSPATGFVYFWNYGKKEIELAVNAGELVTGVAYHAGKDAFYLLNREAKTLKTVRPPSPKLANAFPSVKEWGQGAHLCLFQA